MGRMNHAVHRHAGRDPSLVARSMLRLAAAAACLSLALTSSLVSSQAPAISATDVEGRWILGGEECARDPDARGCADLQTVRIELRGNELVATLDRASGGLARVGVRPGREMFRAVLQPDGALTSGGLRSVYPPNPRCSPDPHLSGINPVRGGRVTAGAVPRLILEFDYLPYDHARCAMHDDRPDRRSNIYHRIAAR